MMINNNYAPLNGMQQGTYPMYAQQQQQYKPAAYTNAIKDDVIKELLAKGNGNNIKISKEEMIKAMCTHRDSTGKSYLKTTNESQNMVKCDICGAEFALVENADMQTIRDAAQSLLDILQTSKSIWFNLPVEYINQYMQIIAVIEHVPELFKIALEDFKQCSGGMPLNNQAQNQMYNSFNLLGQMFGGTNGMTTNYYQQPAGAAVQQPQVAGQMMMNPFGAGFVPVQQPDATQLTPQQDAAPVVPQPNVKVEGEKLNPVAGPTVSTKLQA